MISSWLRRDKLPGTVVSALLSTLLFWAVTARGADDWVRATPDVVLTTAETISLRAGDDEQVRTYLVPTNHSKQRYLSAIEVITGDDCVALEEVWAFDRGALDHFLEVGSQTYFEGAIAERVTPMGRRIPLFLKTDQKQVSFVQWAWPMPPQQTLAVVLRLKSPRQRQILKPKIGLFFVERPYNPSLVVWLESCATTETAYLPEMTPARNAELLALNTGQPTEFSKFVLKNQATQTSWHLESSDDQRFLQPAQNITLLREQTYHLDQATEGLQQEASPGCPTALFLHAADEVERFSIEQQLQKDLWNLQKSRCLAGLEAATNDPTLRLTLGILLAQGGELDQAIEQWAKVTRSQPDHFHSHYRLAEAYVAQQKYSLATQHYQTAIELDPQHARSHFEFANVLFLQGKHEQALEHLRQAIEQDGGLVAAHTNIAVLYGMLGESNNQIEHYRTALQLDPGAVRARLGLAQVMARTVSRSAALGVLAEGLRETPSDESLLLARANMLHEHGETEKAREAYVTVLRMHPESIAGSVGFATLLIGGPNPSSGDLARAIYLAEFAADVNSNPDADILSVLAKCYAASGRYDAAITAIDRALDRAEQSNPKGSRIQALQQLGESYRQKLGKQAK